MHVPEISVHVCQYLNLSNYRSFVLTCRLYSNIALEILKPEAVFFGGNKANALPYLKNLCQIISSPQFPEALTARKEILPRSRKRKLGLLDYRATLLNLRQINLHDCHILFSNCGKAHEFYPLIIFSSLTPGNHLTTKQLNYLLYRSAQNDMNYLAIQLLLNGADPNEIVTKKAPIHAAILAKNDEMLTLFLFHNGLANKKDSKRRSPLVLAALINHLTAANLLLVHGAQDDYDPASITPSALHYCLSHNQIELAQAIKQRTNILFIRDNNGGTYLHMAMFFQQDWMLENLDPAGMLHSQDRQLNTALHIAMQKQYEFGIRYLARHHAIYNVENLNQETALSLCPEHLRQLFIY